MAQKPGRNESVIKVLRRRFDTNQPP